MTRFVCLFPGVWEVPMVMWQDLNGGRCSMGDACSNPPTADGVYKMLIKNFERHFTTNRCARPLLNTPPKERTSLTCCYFQGSVRFVLPRRVVHPRAPQGRIHRVPGHHRQYAGSVVGDNMASHRMGEGPAAAVHCGELPAIPVQYSTYPYAFLRTTNCKGRGGGRIRFLAHVSPEQVNRSVRDAIIIFYDENVYVVIDKSRSRNSVNSRGHVPSITVSLRNSFFLRSGGMCLITQTCTLYIKTKKSCVEFLTWVKSDQLI